MPATHDERPIGVFDSGIGGCAVRELFRTLPGESGGTSATPRACRTAPSRARR